MKDDRIYLRHVLECIAAIALHTAGGENTFLTDRKTQKATIRELQELAESISRLSQELKPDSVVTIHAKCFQPLTGGAWTGSAGCTRWVRIPLARSREESAWSSNTVLPIFC